MRRRDRISGAATLDAPKSPPAAAPGVAHVGRRAVIDVVDDALSVASRRQMFTRDEALDLLHEVEGAARAVPAGPQVLEIVDRANRATAAQLMCARADLVDPLLDIRSVLAG